MQDESFKDALKTERADLDDRTKMKNLLKDFEQQMLAADPEAMTEISNQFADKDIEALGSDEIWRLMTPSQRATFHRLVDRPETMSAFEDVPWWTRTPPFPPLPELPSLSSVFKGVPSPQLSLNMTEVVLAYIAHVRVGVPMHAASMVLMDPMYRPASIEILLQEVRYRFVTVFDVAWLDDLIVLLADWRSVVLALQDCHDRMDGNGRDKKKVWFMLLYAGEHHRVLDEGSERPAWMKSKTLDRIRSDVEAMAKQLRHESDLMAAERDRVDEERRLANARQSGTFIQELDD
jgi:hypothetical protein